MGSKIYSAMTHRSQIGVFDEELNPVSVYKLTENSGVKRIARKDDILFCANAFDGSVARINTSTGEIVKKNICAYPTGIVVYKDNIIVSCGETDTIYVLNTDLELKKIFSAHGFPIHLSISDNILVITKLYRRRVTLYNLDAHEAESEIDVSGFPNCAYIHDGDVFVAYSDEGYFSNGFIERISKEGKSIKKAKAYSMPSALCLHKENLYCLNTGSDSMGIYDIENLTEKKLIKDLGMPDDIVIINDKIFVSCMTGGNVVKLSITGEFLKRSEDLGETRGLAV